MKSTTAIAAAVAALRILRARARRGERGQLLFERKQPRRDQVHVLQQQPVAVARALAQRVQRLDGLSAAHRHRHERGASDHGGGQLLELGARVGAGGRHKQQRLGGRALAFVQRAQHERRRRERGQLQRVGGKDAHGRGEAVGPQHLHEQQALEGGQRDLLFGELGGHLALRIVGPRAPRGFVQPRLRDQRGEGRGKGAKQRRAVGGGPRRQGGVARGSGRRRGGRRPRVQIRVDEFAEKELPLAFGKEVRVQHVRKVQRKHEAVGLEQRARHVTKHDRGQTLNERGHQLLGRGARTRTRTRTLLLVLLEVLPKQLEKGGQREAVHVAHRAQRVHEEERETAGARDRPVHFALLIDRRLHLLGRHNLLRHVRALALDLIERRDQRRIVENVALRGGQLQQQVLFEPRQLHAQFLALAKQRRLARLELGVLVRERGAEQLRRGWVGVSDAEAVSEG